MYIYPNLLNQVTVRSFCLFKGKGESLYNEHTFVKTMYKRNLRENGKNYVVYASFEI